MSDGSRTALSKSTFHFAAGLGSGVLSAVLLQPIDLLKTRVQQSGAHSLRAAIAEIRSAPRLLPALWRGAVPSALRTGFGSAIYFTSLNAIRQSAARLAPSAAIHNAGGGATTTTTTSSSLPKLSNTTNLVSGALARSLAGFILMPLTVLKVRYESTFYNYTSLASAARDIAAKEGLRGFFAGYGATAIRDAPYAGLYVLFYEQSKKRLSALFPAATDDDNLPSTSATKTKTNPDGRRRGEGSRERGMALSHAASINFTSGMLSGVICSVVSNPFDAVKTRIQLHPAAYRNMAQAATRMVHEEGARALWDGLALRMSRKAVSSALAWTVYEELVRRLERGWDGGRAREGI
ncbi:solute carrier family 25 member 38 [Parathielavia hyrcaniae]|uniref:Mitochondrial glycine transporter n=1 Tax=Parathielavia hyrcaniae TaxID=113614 RepID=A0AAN6Q3X2_9PEZI|nr:solute carrier family 25 member 38 [Parathielavia hyrcaniae]